MTIFPRGERGDDAIVILLAASGSRLIRTSFRSVLFAAVVALQAWCAVAADLEGHSAANGSATLSASALSDQKSPAENPEHARYDVNPGTDQTGPPKADNSDSSPVTEANTCKREIPAQESFLDKVIRILFRSHGCSRNMETDTSLSAGGAGGG